MKRIKQQHTTISKLCTWSSTPKLKNIPENRCSISLSTIDDGGSSSSSAQETNKSCLQDNQDGPWRMNSILTRYKKTTGKKRAVRFAEVKSKWETRLKKKIKDTSDPPSPKKVGDAPIVFTELIDCGNVTVRRKKTTDKKRRAAVRFEETESEWETILNETIKDTSVNSPGFSSQQTHKEYQNNTPTNCYLFEDPPSPEKVGDAPIVFTELIDCQNVTVRRKKTTDKKRCAVILFKETESKWETRLEETIKENSVNFPEFSSKQTNKKCQNYNLAENPSCPEKVRNAPIVYKALPESPILGSARRLRSISDQFDIVQHKEFLPVQDLELSKTNDASSKEANDVSPIFSTYISREGNLR